MQTIWKYQLVAEDEQVINVPLGATALDVQTQHGRPCLWLLVDPEAEATLRRVLIRGTGHDCEGIDPYSYMGTFQIQDGDLVFHVFDGGELK